MWFRFFIIQRTTWTLSIEYNVHTRNDDNADLTVVKPKEGGGRGSQENGVCKSDNKTASCTTRTTVPCSKYSSTTIYLLFSWRRTVAIKQNCSTTVNTECIAPCKISNVFTRACVRACERGGATVLSLRPKTFRKVWIFYFPRTRTRRVRCGRNEKIKSRTR